MQRLTGPAPTAWRLGAIDPRQQIPDVETGDAPNCRPASRAPEPSRGAKTAAVHASPGAKERQREG